MKVQVQLSQESRKGLTTISSVEYSINDKQTKLDLAKLSYSLTNIVFRKLEKQDKHGVKFGVKVSRSFNLKVIIDNKLVFDLAQVFLKVTDGAKIKVNNKLYRDNRLEAKKAFENLVLCVLIEAEESQKDFSDVFELND